MFQSFVPFMFHFHGPVVAGKMGATMQVYNIVNALSQSWTNTKTPKMGILSAKRDFFGLRSLVKQTYLRSVMACILFSTGAFSVIYLLNIYKIPLAERFATLPSIVILLITLIAMQLPNIETTAIRFQKKEPFVANSIMSAILVIISNSFLGRYFGIIGSVIGFAFIMMLVLIPWCHKVYNCEMRKF